MNKLKIILQSNLFYYLFIIFLCLYIIFFTIVINYKSKYNNETIIEGQVLAYSYNNKELKVLLKGQEKIQVFAFLDENPNILIGDKITLEGTMNNPVKNTLPNTFNYQAYLYHKHIYKTFSADKIKINSHGNYLQKIKNKIISKVEQYDNTNIYMKLFILGDKSEMDENTYSLYKNNGIAHLLAISGMHLSLFIQILKKILKRFTLKKQETIISIFLIFYLYLTTFPVSMLRCTIFYFTSIINKHLKLNVSSLKRLLLVGFTLLLFNPFYLYDVGFQYSFVISLGIILSQKNIKGNYLQKCFIISLLSFLFSLPITASLNYEINITSILINIIMVPYVSFILYPASLINFLFSPFNIIFAFLVKLFVNLNIWLENFNYFINLPKMSLYLFLLYYLILILFIISSKKIYLSFLFSILIFNKIMPTLDNNLHIYYVDVGQGDSSLIITPYHKNIIMIDTGGKIMSNVKVSDKTILFLKSIGITKINALVMTHGDFDHIGDAINVIDKLNVKEVVFNSGDYNDLENLIIKELKQKNIKYSQGKITSNLPNLQIYFLDTKVYDNENDNSNVLYFVYQNYKFLFMGDASLKRETDILNKYALYNIDFLKIGHHGSNTSSGPEFIKELKPKNCLISVGKNNRYGHPKQSVLDLLNNCNIYRTDEDGSIEIKINNSYIIKTYNP